jgi:hypothetical protein
VGRLWVCYTTVQKVNFMKVTGATTNRDSA